MKELFALSLLFAPPATPDALGFYGLVTDRDGAPVPGVCIWIGDRPPADRPCLVTTDDVGRYSVSLDSAPAGIRWDLTFRFDWEGRVITRQTLLPGPGPTRVDVRLP